MLSLLQKLFRTPAFEEYEIKKVDDGQFVLVHGEKEYQVDFVKDKHDPELWRLKKVERLDGGAGSRFEFLQKLWEIKDKHNRSVIGAAMIGWLKPNEIFEQLKTQSSLAESKSKIHYLKRFYRKKPIPVDTRLSQFVAVPTHQNQPKKEFRDPLGMFKPVSRPVSWARRRFHIFTSNNSAKGGDKQVDRRDGQSIQLKLFKSREQFTDEQIRQNRYALRLLSPYKSICPCVIIDRKTVLAPDGGKDVYWDVIDEGKKLALSQYKGFCEDMMKVHARDIYFGDIKSPNFVVKNDEPVVLIDLDSIVSFDLLQDHKNHPEAHSQKGKVRLFTKAYTTRKLISLREKTVPEEMAQKQKQKLKQNIKKLNRAADEYALLLCMLEATCSIDADIILDIDSYNFRGVLAEGNLDYQTQKNIRTWVNTNIKPEHQAAVQKFLRDPAKNLLPKPLFELVNWK